MPAPLAETPLPTAQTLAEHLGAEVITALDFANRFAPFAAVQTLVLSAGEWVVWAEGAEVRLHRWDGEPTPLAAAEVHLVFEQGAPVAIEEALRSALVAAMSGELAALVWARLDGLFAECAPAARHLFAGASGVFGPDVIEAYLDSGVLVAYHPEAIEVSSVGTATRQFLAAEDGKDPEWHLVVQVQFSAALRIAEARRILAEGPGPSYSGSST